MAVYFDWRVTYTPKKKAVKDKGLAPVEYYAVGDTKVAARIWAANLLQEDGLEIRDYFNPVLVELTPEEQVAIANGEDKKEPEPEAVEIEFNDAPADEPPADKPLTKKAIAEAEKQAAEEAKKAADEKAAAHAEWVKTEAKKIDDRVAQLLTGQRLRLRDVPDDIYHATNGIGSTAMKQAARSMAHYKAYCDKQQVISPTLQAIFDFGRAAHCLVLEPHLFDDNFVSLPEGMAKRGKPYTAFCTEHGDKTILPHDAFQHVLGIGESIKSSRRASVLFRAGESEVSYWYKDETGLILKARVDHDHGDLGVDLKTMQDASDRKIMRTVKFDYWVQDALYRRAAQCTEMVFVGIEKEPPYALSISSQGANARMLGDIKLRKLIDDIAHAVATDNYPAYDDSVVHQTELTRYELDELDQLLTLYGAPNQ